MSTRAFAFQPLTRAAITAAVFALSVALAACEGRDGHEPARRATQGDSAEAGGEVVDSTLRNPDAAWITDGNVLALAGVFNTRQMAAANVELDTWHTDTIRTYATTIAHEHAELQRAVDSLAARLKIAPVMSALDLQIDSAFRARIDSLRALRGAPLERAFAHQQVVAEQAIADYADQLTGAARAPEIRALMESTANGARARLTRAKAFDVALATADSIKAAAVADSIQQAEERRAERAAAREARRRASHPTP